MPRRSGADTAKPLVAWRFVCCRWFDRGDSRARKKIAGPSPRTSTAEVDAVHHHPLNLAGIAAAHLHATRLERESGDRHDQRRPNTNRCCDEGVVRLPAGRLRMAEAGATAMDERLLEAQDVPGKGGGVIVDHGLPHGWPSTRRPSQHVHPRPARRAFPHRIVERLRKDA